RGHSLFAALGSYEAAGRQHYSVGAVLKWLLWHVAELDLYLALLPFAALLLLALLARGLPFRAQAFVAASVALTAWLVLEVPAFVVVYYAVTLAPIENGRHGMRIASLGALFQGITTGKRDWIDAAVGRGADVTVVRSGRTDAFTLWENEFFNRSVGRVVELASPLGGGLPSTQAIVDRRTGDLYPHARADYVLTDDAVPLEGTVVARDTPKRMVLLRVEGPLRVTQLVEGVYPDTWSENQVRYTRLRCTGGSVSVQVSSDPHLFYRPKTLT